MSISYSDDQTTVEQKDDIISTQETFLPTLCADSEVFG